MKKHLSISFETNSTPQEVYNAINNVAGWWSGEVEGITDQCDAEFTYTVPGIHFSKQKIKELVPFEKIVWEVTDAQLEFVENKKEWQGTQISFEILPLGEKTQVLFQHIGLVPGNECYNNCASAWGLLINKDLKNFIETNIPQPTPW